MGAVGSSNVISRAGSGARCVGTDAQAASNAASVMGTNERRSVITTSAKGQIIDNARRPIEWLGPGKYSLTASPFGVVRASRSLLLLSPRERRARSAAIRRESHSRNWRHHCAGCVCSRMNGDTRNWLSSFATSAYAYGYRCCVSGGEKSLLHTILPPPSATSSGFTHVQLYQSTQGLYAHRAADRGRHHRHLGRDRDPEVRQHEVEGGRHGDEVGPAQPRHG